MDHLSAQVNQPEKISAGKRYHVSHDLCRMMVSLDVRKLEIIRKTVRRSNVRHRAIICFMS